VGRPVDRPTLRIASRRTVEFVEDPVSVAKVQFNVRGLDVEPADAAFALAPNESVGQDNLSLMSSPVTGFLKESPFAQPTPSAVISTFMPAPSKRMGAFTRPVTENVDPRMPQCLFW
jgi:hypothetical protein